MYITVTYREGGILKEPLRFNGEITWKTKI